MIPYELIVTSAARPHLLEPTLASLLAKVDQAPLRVVIHDDAAFPGRWEATQAVVLRVTRGRYHGLQLTMHHADPPRRLGLSVSWLFANLLPETEYVLYSQDDFVTVRDVPVARALWVMGTHGLNQIRFNKRATMAFKETWAGRWDKEERTFGVPPASLEVLKSVLYGAPAAWTQETLTVSDHWYFQLGLWRVSEIRKALAFWTETPLRTRQFSAEDPEGLINHYFDQVAYGGDWVDPRVRAACQRTFIWGGIGEDRYIRHIGGDRNDWAGDHERSGSVDDTATAWREIGSYDKELRDAHRQEPAEGDRHD